MWATLILLLPLLGLGLLFIYSGWTGKQIGDEPRCAKCSYNLTGLESNNCPECGQNVYAPDGATRGIRKRRWVLLTIGLLMAVPSAYFSARVAYKAASRKGLYPYYPFAWVLDAATNDSNRACNELDRRLKAGGLSDDELSQIAETALSKQSSPTPGPNLAAWLVWLERLDSSQHLTPDQLERYIDQLAKYSLTIRSPIRVGDPLPITIKYAYPVTLGASHYVGRNDDYILTIDGLACDDCILDPHKIVSHAVFNGTPVRLKISEQARELLPPGKHELRITTNLSLYDSAQLLENKQYSTPPDHARKVETTAEVEILPANAPDPVRYLKNSAQYTQQLYRQIEIEDILVSPTSKQDMLSVYIRIGLGEVGRTKLSASVSFDVILRTSVGDLPVGSVARRAGTAWSPSVDNVVPRFDDKTVTVILRSSPDAARHTLDIFEIWQGSLVFKDVPVHRP